MDLVFNLRLAARFLVRHPRFALGAILPLALGMGATVAAFSVVRGVLLRPLPFADPDRLVVLQEFNPKQAVTSAAATESDLLDWRDRSRSFEGLESYSLVEVGWPFGGDVPDAQTARVTPGFFRLLGVGPILTVRPLGAGGPLISHGLWQRRFGGDPRAVGRTLDLYDLTFKVSGVMPSGFAFPPGVDAWDVVPASRPAVRDEHRNLVVLGRLRSGISLEDAQAELNVIARQLSDEYPQTNAGWEVRVLSLQDRMVGAARPAVVAVLVVAVLLLLTGCVNLASLLIARATERRQEFGIRRALGARFPAILLETLAESALIATLAGVLGTICAGAALSVFLRAAADVIPRAADVRLDETVLVFAVSVAAATALICALAPAWLACRRPPEESLRPVATPGATSHRLLAGVTIAEVALATVLLMSANQVLRAYAQLRSIDLGFRPEHVSVTRLWILPGSPRLAAQRFCPEQGTAGCDYLRPWFDELLERVRAIPGVRQAALSEAVPMEGRDLVERRVRVDDSPSGHGDALVVPVSADYFDVLETRLVAGRLVQKTDRATTERVAVVNRTAAGRFWPGRSAIGQTLTIVDDRAGTRNVVGIVEDVRFQRPGIEARPAVYVPLDQYFRSFLALTVRADVPLEAVAGPLRRALESERLRPGTPESLDELLNRTVARPRFTSWTLATFGSMALLLAGSGVFSVLALVVRLRRRDIAIRIALGATRRFVVGHILMTALAWAVAGVIAGVAAGVALGSAAMSLFPEIPRFEFAAIAASAAVLLLVAMIGAMLPARSAARSDPAAVLRSC